MKQFGGSRKYPMEHHSGCPPVIHKIVHNVHWSLMLDCDGIGKKCHTKEGGTPWFTKLGPIKAVLTPLWTNLPVLMISTNLFLLNNKSQKYSVLY